MLTHLFYQPEPDDQESIEKQLILLKKFPQAQLEKFIHKWKQDGLEGAHLEATMMLAIHTEYLRRFDRSPLYFEYNSVIGIKPLSKVTDQERLSRMQYELNLFGEIMSDDLMAWWINRY